MTPVPSMSPVPHIDWFRPFFNLSDDTSPKHSGHFVSSIRYHQSQEWRQFCFTNQMTPVPSMAAILFHQWDVTSPEHGGHFVSFIRWHQSKAWRPFCYIYKMPLVPSMASILFHLSDDTMVSQAWRPICFLHQMTPVYGIVFLPLSILGPLIFAILISLILFL